MTERVPSNDRGEQAAAISDEMARMHRDYYGRGATTVRTVIERNYVCSVLEDIFTPLERTLIEAGNWSAVRETRLAFQDAMADRFTTTVTEITGQKVRAFLSQVHQDPAMALEFFALEAEEKDRADAKA